MDATDLLRDGFCRVASELPDIVKGLRPDNLLWIPRPGTNPIGWLTWHIARCEDAQVAPMMGIKQVWTAQDWVSRFGLPYPTDAIGYGQNVTDVAQFNVTDADLLLGYYANVHTQTETALAAENHDTLERIVDERWVPAVTAGVRWMSVLNDVTQHLGQAAYLRGLIVGPASD